MNIPACQNEEYIHHILNPFRLRAMKAVLTLLLEQIVSNVLTWYI